MKRLHLLAREGHPSIYIAEIEGSVQADQSLGASLSSFLPGTRFSDTFRVERVYPLTNRQVKARIRQYGLIASPTVRFSFTSWIPFDLEEGASYWLDGVLRDRPFRDHQQVVLDEKTRVRRSLRLSKEVRNHLGGREIHPRPPKGFEPLLSTG